MLVLNNNNNSQTLKCKIVRQLRSKHSNSKRQPTQPKCRWILLMECSTERMDLKVSEQASSCATCHRTGTCLAGFSRSRMEIMYPQRVQEEWFRRATSWCFSQARSTIVTISKLECISRCYSSKWRSIKPMDKYHSRLDPSTTSTWTMLGSITACSTRRIFHRVFTKANQLNQRKASQPDLPWE